MIEETTALRASDTDSAPLEADEPQDNASAELSIGPQSPDRFINRELSWLSFNQRVMEESYNTSHPLFERLRFLSISAKNLDEFYMVRVAGLKAQDSVGVTTRSPDGLTPAQQLDAINVEAVQLMADQQTCWQSMQSELRDEGIFVVRPEELSASDRKWVDGQFMRDIFPVLTPMAIDPIHPFPFIPNFGLTLALLLENRAEGAMRNAIVPLPAQLDRFIRLPGEVARYLLLEDAVLICLDRLFPGYSALDHGVFRVIRDSEMEIDDEAQDLVKTFETALKRRRRGSVVRLTVNSSMPAALSDVVRKELDVEADEVIVLNGLVGLVDIERLITKNRPDLVFPSYNARFPERVLDFDGNCFAAIKAKDFVVHHPYESFDVVVDFVRQAARDPNVVAIKQTLYRTSKDSPIIHALIEAAEAGKSVTAMVELKARFDEEANIRWARDLERAGCHVVFGFRHIKTHAKVSLVVRRESGELRTYVHFGTGNYHPLTAKIYTDLSFFTCLPELGQDAAALFNYMTGYARPTDLNKISISPLTLRRRLEDGVRVEMENAKMGKPAQIWAKMNSVVDEEFIDLLYEASQAGVSIDLVVRGMCCLRPGVPGLSENIRVKSIVGRFLEHSRIVCFANGGKIPSKRTQVFISSADWMKRNLDWRVETLVPIENDTVRAQILEEIMVSNFKDETSSWVLGADGRYDRVSFGADSFSAHHYFMTNPSLSGRGSALDEEKKRRRRATGTTH